MSDDREDDKVDVEDLLSKMPLVRPSKALDDSVDAMIRRIEFTPGLGARGFGWSSMLLVALAASLIGILVGRLLPTYPSQSMRAVASSKPLIRRAPQIVERGFELLDGERPVRVFQVRRRGNDADVSLPVLEKVIIRSPEI